MLNPANRALFTLQEPLYRPARLKSEVFAHGFFGPIGEIAQGDSGSARRESCEVAKAEERARGGRP